MERKSGLYWVMIYESWHVGYFSERTKKWNLSGSIFFDKELEVINHNRIMSPDEWE